MSSLFKSECKQLLPVKSRAMRHARHFGNVMSSAIPDQILFAIAQNNCCVCQRHSLWPLLLFCYPHSHPLGLWHSKYEQNHTKQHTTKLMDSTNLFVNTFQPIPFRYASTFNAFTLFTHHCGATQVSENARSCFAHQTHPFCFGGLFCFSNAFCSSTLIFSKINTVHRLL